MNVDQSSDVCYHPVAWLSKDWADACFAGHVWDGKRTFADVSGEQ